MRTISSRGSLLQEREHSTETLCDLTVFTQQVADGAGWGEAGQWSVTVNQFSYLESLLPLPTFFTHFSLQGADGRKAISSSPY